MSHNNLSSVGMRVLLTGGLGYIGSHAAVALMKAGCKVVILDNLSNSSPIVLNRIKKITGNNPVFIQGDIRNKQLLSSVLLNYRITAVMHFAGLKSVSESVKNPLFYYDNNVTGTLSLCAAMVEAGVFNLVFSSSATVYGKAEIMPVTESTPTGIPTNPYGRSKLMVEEALIDLAHSNSRWSIALLRYFNPVGAHESGEIGEDPSGVPNNLLPYILQVAVGRLPNLSVYGNDYATVDGTGVRDYIHVMDLVDGHLLALSKIVDRQSGIDIWNLGTGRGTSVLEMVAAFEAVSGVIVPFTVKERRPGDVAECWADVSKIHAELGWKPQHDLHTMLEHSWKWQIKNPQGYD